MTPNKETFVNGNFQRYVNSWHTWVLDNNLPISRREIEDFLNEAGTKAEGEKLWEKFIRPVYEKENNGS